MYGIGLPELLVIALVVALLFGTPILTFFVGYVVGKNRAATTAPEPTTVPDAEPATEPTSEPAPAQASTAQPPTPEEPADE